MRHEESRMSMGSMFTVAAYGPNTPKVPDLITQALDEVDRIDKLMSHYKPDSQTLEDQSRWIARARSSSIRSCSI